MEDELYLENIDELVTDQNKIVTYKWLSHTLGVHVNQAKQMLYDYVTRKRKESGSARVHVTYLVSGKSFQDGYHFHRVAVVKEEKLEATKEKLAEVASVHVYSIQKAALKDSSPLYNTDYDIVKNNLHNCNKFSAIRCPEAVPRSVEEISKLQKANQLTEEANVTSKPRINGHAPVSKTAAQQNKGIMGMFSQQASKQQEVQKETKVDPKEPSITAASSKPSAKSIAMNNFFGKASLNKIKEGSSSSNTVKEEESPPDPSASIRNDPPEVKPVKKPSEQMVKTGEPAKEKKRLKRVEMSDSDEEKEKLVIKRRRIKQPTQDSSDDEECPPPPRDIKTPSPPPDPEPKTKAESQPQPGVKRRKRKRVLKSQTFMDDDGCIVTEKGYVSESCTDSGEDCTRTAAIPKTAAAKGAKPDTKAEPKPSKKISAASKGVKQASIMGFFQKK
ncbi:hypothetical protein GDO86_004833 [Hymenochirus boettgeri]|uniref:DNA polymerase delta subunit 3 n=1 Tax=Hymenochirus boettgeri TaxID=247094 RepID=A0A8T2KC38_9PIPI|nr:hypothetical protein GDO86_004833 [Hymenochirus boettgeri]KAG8453161.1 hypothetical protein GDO86_004833 [Hymenochirus boettgeri]